MRHSRLEILTALRRSYESLRPFSGKAPSEFNNHLKHLLNIAVILESLPADAAILDVGCYIGLIPLALRYLGYDAAGTDKYVFYSRENGNSFGFSQAELSKLERIWADNGLAISASDNSDRRLDGEYDLVISLATLEHQPYPREFLESLARCAKEGGNIYLATPNGLKLANRMRVLLGRPIVPNIEEFYMGGHDFNGHWREYAVSEVAEMGRLSGLGVVSARTEQIGRIKFLVKKPRKWPRSLARLIGRFVPGMGDTGIVVFKKQVRGASVPATAPGHGSRDARHDRG